MFQERLDNAALQGFEQVTKKNTIFLYSDIQSARKIGTSDIISML